MLQSETPRTDTDQPALLLALTSAAIIAVIVIGLCGLSVGIQWLHRAF